METDKGADVNILLSHLSSDQRVGRELIHLPITPDREFYGLQTATGVAGDRGQNEHPIAVGLHDEGKPGGAEGQSIDL